MIIFEECTLSEVRNYIEENHYSKSVNGCKVSKCFVAKLDGSIVGASLFGELSTTAWKKYATSEKSVVELRRLVTTLKDKNFLSKFLSWQIKQMKKTTKYDMIISYADPYYNHVGFIYQATNWKYLGKTNKDVLLQTPDGRLYHSRAMRTKYNGELKPFAKRLVELEKDNLLIKIEVPGKHIYQYFLRKTQVSNPEMYPKVV